MKSSDKWLLTGGAVLGAFLWFQNYKQNLFKTDPNSKKPDPPWLEFNNSFVGPTSTPDVFIFYLTVAPPPGTVRFTDWYVNQRSPVYWSPSIPHQLYTGQAVLPADAIPIATGGQSILGWSL